MTKPKSKQRVQLTNLSAKATELRTQKILRENKLGPTHVHISTLGDKLPRGYVTCPPNQPYVKPKAPNTAEAVNHPAITRKGCYLTGDGDTKQFIRIGSDHSNYKSKGLLC